MKIFHSVFIITYYVQGVYCDRKYADQVNKMRSVLHDTLTLVLAQPDPHLVTLTGAVQIVSFLGPQVCTYIRTYVHTYIHSREN